MNKELKIISKNKYGNIYEREDKNRKIVYVPCEIESEYLVIYEDYEQINLINKTDLENGDYWKIKFLFSPQNNKDSNTIFGVSMDEWITLRNKNYQNADYYQI